MLYPSNAAVLSPQIKRKTLQFVETKYMYFHFFWKILRWGSLSFVDKDINIYFRLI
jgi:hypothetical protein